jgi:hypothetical protein
MAGLGIAIVACGVSVAAYYRAVSDFWGSFQCNGSGSSRDRVINR